MISFLIIYTLIFFLFAVISFFKEKNILHPIFLLLVVYYYVTSGPLWALYFYDTPLPLVVQDNINASIILFSCAIIGIGIAQIMPRLEIKTPSVKINERVVYNNLLFFISILNIIALSMLIIFSSTILMFDKGYLLSNSDLFIFHRNYTLLMFICIPFLFYFTFISTKSILNKKKLVIINVVFYIIYMFLTQERDFILLLLVCMVIYNVHVKKIRMFNIILSFITLVLLFSILFFVRVLLVGGDTIGVVENLLNQGSNITISSNIIQYVHETDYKYGYTFFQSFVNLMPSFIYRLGIPLSDWFVMQFFPHSNSGYGFSLEAEAYLNGGYFVCILLFFLLTLILRNLYFAMCNKKIVLGSLFCSYFPFLLYAIRGDSLMLIKSTLFSFLILMAILFFSAFWDGKR